MAGKRVAVVGEVKATPAPASGTLTWEAVDPPGVTYSSYTWLTVGGVVVIHGAICGFIGTDSSTGAKTPSTVTLPSAPAPTTLQHGASNVLRHGDTAQD